MTLLPFSRNRFGISSIRLKTLLLILVALLTLLAVCYVPLEQAHSRSVLALEYQSVLTDVERARQVLAFKQAALDTLLRPYASWNETYQFMETRDPVYTQVNLNLSELVSNELSVVFLLDTQQRVVFVTSIDAQSRQSTPAPTDFVDQFTINPGMNSYSPASGPRNGILVLKEGILLFAARPIFQNEGTGVARGTMVFGRFLDAEALKELNEITQFPFTLAVATETSRNALGFGGGDNTTIARPVDEQYIEGFGLIHDYRDEPSLIVRVERPRTLYYESRQSLRSLALAFLGGGIVVWLVVALVIDRFVLTRILDLGVQVHKIGVRKHLQARVFVAGRDELAELSESINTMLTALEQAETERQQAENARLAALETVNAQLQANLAEGRRMERLKSEFISVVSHELRTPLTSIRGSLGLVNGGVTGVLPEQAKDLLRIAQNNSERLVRLVNDILDIEKIEAGSMTYNLRPLSVCPLVQQALEENHAFAAQHGVCLVLESSCDIEVNVDRDRTIQVITNLISNAAKFSPPNSAVTTTITCDDQLVYVAVSDHGPGIPQGFYDRIFQKFAQADASDTRGKGGTGLGLSVTKALVEGMGGRVFFVCPPSGGTVFTVALPKAIADI